MSIVGPSRVLHVSYEGRPFGGMFEVRVAAELPVDVYVMVAGELGKYLDSDPDLPGAKRPLVDTIVSSEVLAHHTLRFRSPTRGFRVCGADRWHLVIRNP